MKINDSPQTDLTKQQDKLFIALSAITLPVLFGYYFIASIFDHASMGMNIDDVIMIFLCIICLILTVVAVKKDCVKKIAPIISLLIVIEIIPEAASAWEGINNGDNAWFLVGVLYISIIIEGRKKYIFFAIEAIMAAILHVLNYLNEYELHPNYALRNSITSYIILILVSIMIVTMVTYEIRKQKEALEKIEAQNNEIDALYKSQNRFFSNMSHEIRTPINTIIGLNEMILREDISDEVAEDAENIQAASRLLLHLINDILDMSKFESGQMQLTEVSYHPGDMISEVVGMLWIRAKEKNLEFHINIAPDIPGGLLGDDVRIKQVLINIVGNAIKYTKEGSVTLSIQCGERNDNTVNIIYSVTDTGMGIKKEDMPYLFSAFKRVDEQANRHIEGTGLGLAIVKQIVDMMNGKISVNSVYTKGTTFIIEIPQVIVDDVQIGEFNLEERHKVKAVSRYKKRFEAPEAKVLVVDDSESNLLVVSKLLRNTGVKIDTASSGREALSKTLDTYYHVIFMDHLMPEMDGIECVRLIRKQTGGRSRDSKMVILTANADARYKSMYEKEGFDGYLIKPVTGDELERQLFGLLPSDIVYSTDDDDSIAQETMSWMQSHKKKRHVVIATESVADLPKEIIEKYDIAVMPHIVCTAEGEFRDGQEIDTKGLLTYMSDESHKVHTTVPTVDQHEAFFAELLSYANDIIYIVVSKKVANSGYNSAMDAAAAFENVSVVDSGHLSSGQGLMVIEACKMAADGKSASQIVSRLEQMKKHVHTSFIVDNLDFLARAGQISRKTADLIKAFFMRPVLVLKKGRMGVGFVYIGSTDRAWKKYIEAALSNNNIDTETLFVTYVGLTTKELENVKNMVEEKMHFDNVYFQLASPAIAVNCGAGTFGLLYSEKF